MKKLSEKLCCTTRTINNYENALDRDWIIISANSRTKRNGQRRNGKIIWAAGINLKPIIDKVPEIRNCLEISENRKIQCEILRKEITHVKRILNTLGFDEEVTKVFPRGRPSELKDFCQLKNVLRSLEQILSRKFSETEQKCLLDGVEKQKRPNTIEIQELNSCTKNKIQTDNDFAYLSLENLRECATNTFVENWKYFEATEGAEKGFSRAAQAVFATWGGSSKIWWDFIESHGLMMASLCVYLTDKNSQSDSNPKYFVKNPVGCFIGQGRAIEKGTLNLHGLLSQMIQYERKRNVS